MIATVSTRVPRFWAQSLTLARQCQRRGAGPLSPLIVVAAAQGRLHGLRMFGTGDAEALSPARATGGDEPLHTLCSRLLVRRIGQAVHHLCKVRSENPTRNQRCNGYTRVENGRWPCSTGVRVSAVRYR